MIAIFVWTSRDLFGGVAVLICLLLGFLIVLGYCYFWIVEKIGLLKKRLSNWYQKKTS